MALVRQEFQKQERRGAFGRSTTPGLLFHGRLALGSAAVVLAAFLGLVGLYGRRRCSAVGRHRQPRPGIVFGESRDLRPSEGTSIIGSTATTFSNGSTTEPTDPSTTDTMPVTGPTTSMPVTGPTTSAPGSTQPTTPPSSAPSSTVATSRPTTTNAPTPTTSGGGSTITTTLQVMTSEQRESSARSAATRLADKVVLDDLDGAASVLAPGAGSGSPRWCLR